MTTKRIGCPLDTDGDGNCPIHPEGCPSELAAMLARVCDAADAAIVSRDRDTPPFGAKGYVRCHERNALRAAVDAARTLLARCPECEGSGTVRLVDWPGEHANQKQEPCPKCSGKGVLS